MHITVTGEDAKKAYNYLSSIIYYANKLREHFEEQEEVIIVDGKTFVSQLHDLSDDFHAFDELSDRW